MSEDKKYKYSFVAHDVTKIKVPFLLAHAQQDQAHVRHSKRINNCLLGMKFAV